MEITLKLNDAELATLSQFLSEAANRPGALQPLIPPDDGKLSVSIEEAARMLSCAPVTVRKFIRQRRLPRLDGFRHILIPKAALEKFVKDSTKVQ